MKKILPILLLCLADYCLIFAQKSSPETSAELTLIGTVFDEDTRKPIVASLAVEVKEFEPLTFNADATGRFAVGVPTPSKCMIIAKAEGFETLQQTYSFAGLNPRDSVLRICMYMIPVEKAKVLGKVLSSKDNTPLSGQIKMHVNSDFSHETYEMFTGSYSKSLTAFGWHILEISAPGFLTVTDTVWVVKCNRRTISKDYYLKPIEVGLTVQLKNVYFNFGAATLKPESFVELNRVADLFKQNPSMQFEIAGHTDSEGEDDYNIQLSQNRAQAIATYLVDKGVNTSQLIVRGYGESMPIDSNLTASGKFNNRRVEFIVAANNQ